MPQINVAPTRTNLIRLKKEIRFAKEGYEILDRKREALTGELVRVAKEADTLQKEVWAMLATAYDAMEKARLVMGSDHVEWASLAVNKTVDVHLRLRGIMGVASKSTEKSIRIFKGRDRYDQWIVTIEDVGLRQRNMQQQPGQPGGRPGGRPGSTFGSPGGFGGSRTPIGGSPTTPRR